jgi:large subunit ribosomal protein L2
VRRGGGADGEGAAQKKTLESRVGRPSRRSYNSEDLGPVADRVQPPAPHFSAGRASFLHRPALARASRATRYAIGFTTEWRIARAAFLRRPPPPAARRSAPSRRRRRPPFRPLTPPPPPVAASRGRCCGDSRHLLASWPSRSHPRPPSASRPRRRAAPAGSVSTRGPQAPPPSRFRDLAARSRRAPPRAAARRPLTTAPCLAGAAAARGPLLLQAWRSFAAGSRDPALKAYNPTTPGFRGRIITSRKDLWKGGPFKPLTEGLRRTGGRNSAGRITSRQRGGGHRRVYRQVDFKRADFEGRGGAAAAAGTVERVEYDPNRSARIALVRLDGAAESAPLRERYSYILAPQGVGPGDAVAAGAAAPIRPGCTLPLSAIPVGMQVHNVEMRPGAGGQLARAAGTACTLVKKGDDGYAVLRLPSGEQRLVLLRCAATVGALSNPQHKNRKLGKAGATRWLGRRPRVRGVAMNAVDHPHGGGRGKSKGRISQTPWGQPTKGHRTRHAPRTDWAIRLSRHKAKRSG